MFPGKLVIKNQKNSSKTCFCLYFILYSLDTRIGKTEASRNSIGEEIRLPRETFVIRGSQHKESWRTLPNKMRGSAKQAKYEHLE